MKTRTKTGRYHITHKNGVVTSTGGQTASPQNDETVLWFETKKAREMYPGVNEYRSLRTKNKLLAEAEGLKSDLAYSAKRAQADEILAGVPYDATRHDLLEIEVRETGTTPLKAALAVRAAVRRDVYEKENKRVKAREKARKL